MFTSNKESLMQDLSKCVCWLSRCVEDYKCLISKDVQFNKVALINKSNQATSDIDINTNKTQVTEAIYKGFIIEVELFSDHEDDV